MISALADDYRLNAFGREHGWSVCLRGPGRPPARLSGWRSFESARAHVAGAWSQARLRLQAEVDGTAESIVFAAHRGRMLGARHMQPGIDGADGSAWGGRVTDLEEAIPGVEAKLADELSQARWTGGGELEIVRSPDGGAWLVACHPRFPARVHGATLAGANLPAELIAAATGRTPALPAVRGSEFVRVVIDIPLRPRLPLPARALAASGVVRAGDYLSGMPDPPRRRSGERLAQVRGAPLEPPPTLTALIGSLPSVDQTPHAHRADPAARWEPLAARVRRAAGSVAVKLAYSIKTDPDVDLLSAARSHGFLAEAITAAEMGWARQVGFAGEEIVLNGPAKSWGAASVPLRCFGAFADSLDELDTLTAMSRSGIFSAGYLGPRLRPPSVASRFGVDLGDFDTFRRLVATLEEMPEAQSVGVHFHWASSAAGHRRWFETVDATIEWARALQDLSGRAIACLDLGGGWHPDDFDTVLLPRLPDLVARARAQLDRLDLLILEPGRALVQPLGIVETTVLEVRETGDAREIVVDASLAEVPRAGVYPHRILSRTAGGWRHWGHGPDRVVGRLCMEDDVLRMSIAVPDEIRAGARVLIADAGAYDRSMAYRFGRG